MVDLTEMEKQTYTGKITAVEEMTLRKYLELKFLAKAPKVIKQFNEENLDREHLVLQINCDGTALDWFGLIPMARGWPKSNVKKVKERNNLPSDTMEWAGHEIALRVDNNGFLRVAV